ncbi:MAG: hypothetical protein ED557_02340 [Balneola sp.]|nr:MAG: hypothetical protein ED557_02340 [Balneola sp.]
MKKISGSHLYYKVIWPSTIYSFLGLAFLITLIVASEPEDAIILFGSLFMLLLFHITFRKMTLNTYDQVFDYGDYLVFNKGEESIRIELSQIISVDYRRFVSYPPSAIIKVKSDKPEPRVFEFMLPLLNRLSKSPIVEDLQKRIGQEYARH